MSEPSQTPLSDIVSEYFMRCDVIIVLIQVGSVSDNGLRVGAVDDGEKETQREEEEEEDVDIDPVMKRYMMMVSEQRAKVCGSGRVGLHLTSILL